MGSLYLGDHIAGDQLLTVIPTCIIEENMSVIETLGLKHVLLEGP